MLKLLKSVATALCAAFIIAACGPMPRLPQTGNPRLILELKLSMAADGQASAQVGMRNAGTAGFAGSDSFNGVMEVRAATGQPRLAATMHMVGSVPAGEVAFPLEWTGQLDPGTYTLTWQAPGTEGVTVDFAIEQRANGLVMVVPPEYLDPMTDFTVAAP